MISFSFLWYSESLVTTLWATIDRKRCVYIYLYSLSTLFFFYTMFSKVSLYAATAEQIIASRKRTFVEWGRGLTVDEYLDRDAVGEGEDFGRDGKLMTW